MIKRRIPWVKQPQYPIGIDTGNALVQKVAYSSSIADAYDNKSKRFNTLVNNPPVGVSIYGRGRNFTTASSQGIDLPTNNIVNAGSLTVSVITRIDQTSGHIIYSLNGTGYNAILGPLDGSMALDSTSAPDYDGIAGTPVGLVHIVTVHRIGSFDVYYNGVKQPKTSIG